MIMIHDCPYQNHQTSTSIIISILKEFQMVEINLVVEPIASGEKHFLGKCKISPHFHQMLVLVMMMMVMMLMHTRTLLPSGTLHLFPAARCRNPSSLHHHCHHQQHHHHCHHHCHHHHCHHHHHRHHHCHHRHHHSRAIC